MLLICKHCNTQRKYCLQIVDISAVSGCLENLNAVYDFQITKITTKRHVYYFFL
jgi:hypothetical protein